MKKVLIILVCVLGTGLILLTGYHIYSTNKLNNKIQALTSKTKEFNDTKKELDKKIENLEETNTKLSEELSEYTHNQIYTKITKLSLEELKQKINNKETFLLVIVNYYCSHCEEYLPTYQKALTQKNMTSYKIDTNDLDTKERLELEELFEYTGTPTTFKVEKGSVVNTLPGNRDLKEVLDFLGV